MAILELDRVSAGYGPVRVLHDLNLSVNPGERLGLVGLNGHGKTTMLSAIVGLTGWQDGSILFEGKQIGGRRTHGMGRTTPSIVRRGIALAPQGDAIFPGLTVKENLDSGAYTRTTWRSRGRRRDHVLDVFAPLRPLLRQSAGTLSGGERRMVSVGRKISLGLVAALCEIDIGDGAMIIAEQNLPLLQGRVDRVLGMHAGELKQDVGEALGDIPPAAEAMAQGIHHGQAL
ncbi:MAG: ATP-binding cassette domain-containing protein [Actinobacteria bacterium]|nr:ATP-binding cassette domain-containing protein [Actinomycetota bacterium]